MKRKGFRIFLCSVILSTGLVIGCDDTAKETVVAGIESGTQTVVAALITAAFEAAFPTEE